ncbi:dnaJ homolog subfamily C member 30, mitochondrial-like [Gasterosteus aculeatus]
MAEVRLRYGREAYNFAQKSCSRYLVGSRTWQGMSATQASPPSVEFVCGDIGGVERRGAGDSAAAATVGASRDGYIRSVNYVWEIVAEDYRDLGLDKNPCAFKKPDAQRTEEALPRYRAKAKFARRLQSFGSCRGQRPLVPARAYSTARSEPLYKTKTGYYEILEVPPAATQTQIKTAYYKQSFVYHPDRNAASEDATVRFSEISEAYAVLGNKALRRKYDLGLLSPSDLVATARPAAAGSGGSARDPAAGRRSVAGADLRGGGGGVFDFDRFFKSHYSEQLQKQQEIRVRKEEMQKKERETMGDESTGRMMEMGIVVLMAIAFGLVSSLKRG